MFGLEWYGVVGVPRLQRSGVNTAEDAWNGLTLLRWPMLLTVLTALATVVLHASQRSHGARTDTGVAVAVSGTVTALLLAYRVLIDPPNPSSVVDVKLGAFLGLLAAIGIAVGGLESAREERRRRASRRSRSRREQGWRRPGPSGRVALADGWLGQEDDGSPRRK